MSDKSLADSAGAMLQRALALHGDGRFEQALALYEAILQGFPAHAPALHYAGAALMQLGRADAAVGRIERSLSIDSSPADAWCNLALAYEALGRNDQAVIALHEALRRDTRQPGIWSNLASVLLALGRAVEAEQASRRAVALDASHSAGWFNLALALDAQRRTAEALSAAERAAQSAPVEIAPAGLKAQLQAAIGDLRMARETLLAALAQHDDVAALHFQRARVEADLGDVAAAAKACERVLELDATHGPALSELLFLRKRQADWHDLDGLRRRFLAGVEADAPYLSPFCLLSDPSTRGLQRRCAARWSRLFATHAGATARRPLSRHRLKIGYVSSDFHQHATAVLAVGLFERHDRDRFEIHAYSTGPDDGSALRTRLIAAFDRFIDARQLSPADLAQQIRHDGIDILVDLKGYTDAAPTEAVAMQPAPIQVNYLGYPGTMGAPFIDYLIGDGVVTPFDHAADYAETLIQLPFSYQINDGSRAIPEPPPRASLSLPEDNLVLCSFNSAYKLNPDVLLAWCRILDALPCSVLWLLSRTQRDPAIDRLRRYVASLGIDPARLVFAPYRAHAEYLGLYQRADLFLDTWPYNAHTTASDALWAGCPVITWLGETFAGRVAASLLNAVGLPELITDSVDRYVATAIELGREREMLAKYRTYLVGRGRHSALFDTARTTRAIESAYDGMAEQYRRGIREPFRVGGSS